MNETTNTTVRLGDKVRDQITGYEGIAVARTDWLHGCARITVQPDALDDTGKIRDAVTFDELQLTVIETAKAAVGDRNTGGPRPEPQRRTDPR